MRNHGTDPRTRGTLLNERLAAIKEIWTKDTAEFHGEYVDFDPIFSRPKPVQRPHPPIYIGGDGQAALARVAAHGDGWMPHSVRNPARVWPQLNRLAEVVGDVPVIVACGVTRAPNSSPPTRRQEPTAWRFRYRPNPRPRLCAR